MYTVAGPRLTPEQRSEPKKEIHMSNKLLLMVRPLVISSVLASAASNATVTPATPVASPAQAHPDSPLPDCFPCNHA